MDALEELDQKLALIQRIATLAYLDERQIDDWDDICVGIDSVPRDRAVLVKNSQMFRPVLAILTHGAPGSDAVFTGVNSGMEVYGATHWMEDPDDG